MTHMDPVFVSQTLSSELQELGTIIKNYGDDSGALPQCIVSYMFTKGHVLEENVCETAIPFGVSYDIYAKTVADEINRICTENFGLSHRIISANSSLYAFVNSEGLQGYLYIHRSPPQKLVYYVCLPKAGLNEVFSAITERFPKKIDRSINRFYINDRSIDDKEVEMPEPGHIFPDARIKYPWMKQTPKELWDAFYASRSNIILLIGPPGTGKSSFITDLIEARSVTGGTYVADSEAVLLHPGFPDAVRNVPAGSCVITEDSDRLVMKREDGNAGMSALLNITSGVASTTTKLIISTNLSTLKSVDPALLRVGRMFKVLEFRLLTLEEAYAIRAEMDLPYYDLSTLGDSVTLAEAINYDPEMSATNVRTFQVGFAR